MSLTLSFARNHNHPFHPRDTAPNPSRGAALVSAFMVIATASLSTSTALAQGTLRFAWQASLDNGTTWTGDRIEVSNPNAEVLVRARISWQNSPGYALALAQFDAIITGVQGAGLSDQVSNIARVAPVNQASQTLVASRFGEVIKIDDARDDQVPGAGNRFVICNQVFEIAGWPFSRNNPIDIFGYSLHLDGSLGSRIVNQMFPVSAGGAILTPVLFTTPQGGATTPFAISFPLEIAVIPAPSAAILAASLLLLAPRRRR